MRIRKLLPCVALLCLAVPVLAQAAGRGTTETTIKGKKVSINYGRPSLGGRDVLSLAQTGMVWRLGMDKSTQIVSAGDLIVAGKTLKAGKYSLWAKKTGPTSWVLAFHPDADVWGSPELTEGYVAQLPLRLTKAQDSAEELTISLATNKGMAVVRIHWGTAVLSGSFGVI